jgi:hypothetical protein
MEGRGKPVPIYLLKFVSPILASSMTFVETGIEAEVGTSKVRLQGGYPTQQRGSKSRTGKLPTKIKFSFCA